jgi:hypothetical protein
MKSAEEILKELQLHPPAARVRDRSVGDEIEWANVIAPPGLATFHHVYTRRHLR